MYAYLPNNRPKAVLDGLIRNLKIPTHSSVVIYLAFVCVFLKVTLTKSRYGTDTEDENGINLISP